MIDPKMLELKIYDDIPHLLAAGRHRSGKAIRALKWAVEQMEDRYRMMAELGVRNLASFNAEGRRGQGQGQAARPPRPDRLRPRNRAQPIYEEEKLEFEAAAADRGGRRRDSPT